MSWRSHGKRKSHSTPTLGGFETDDLRSSTYREVWSEGQPSSAGTTSWPAGSPMLAAPELLSQAFRLLRGLLLFSMSAAGSAVAALGLGLLGYLLLSRALTPSQHLHTRTLYLDYSKTDLIAQAAFLPANELGDGVVPADLPPGTRFLAAGQRVDVWVDLQLPASSANCRGGMAQVVAELVTLDGRTVARTSRPLLLRRNGMDLWSLLTAPLRWAGLADGARRVRVVLFRNYKEKDKAPFMVFQVAIKTRDPTWAPEVLVAEVAVRLRLGLLRGILYSLRPGNLLMLLLGGMALASVLGGSMAAAVCFALWVYTLWGGRGEALPAGVGVEGEAEDGGSSVLSGAEGEELSGSLSGLSDVESVGGGGGGEGAEAGPSSRPPWPAEEEGVEDWQDVAADASAAGPAEAATAAPSHARRRGLAWGPFAAGKGPASAAVSADDTAFLAASLPVQRRHETG